MTQETDPLCQVITAAEAAQIWSLTKNAVTNAIKRGALRGRQSGKVWLVTVADMLAYQGHVPYHDKIPDELRGNFPAGKW